MVAKLEADRGDIDVSLVTRRASTGRIGEAVGHVAAPSLPFGLAGRVLAPASHCQMAKPSAVSPSTGSVSRQTSRQVK